MQMALVAVNDRLSRTQFPTHLIHPLSGSYAGTEAYELYKRKLNRLGQK